MECTVVDGEDAQSSWSA